jgi:hypothetical protein
MESNKGSVNGHNDAQTNNETSRNTDTDASQEKLLLTNEKQKNEVSG